MTAPRHLLLGGDVTGHVFGDDDAVFPFAEIEAGNQFDFQRAPFFERPRRHAEIVIGDSANKAERDSPVGEMLEDRGRAVNEGCKPILVVLAAAEVPHVAQDVVAAILQPGFALKVVLANPNQAIGIGGAAAKQI